MNEDLNNAFVEGDLDKTLTTAQDNNFTLLEGLNEDSNTKYSSQCQFMVSSIKLPNHVQSSQHTPFFEEDREL